jgi:hypothetical protein
MTFTDLNLDDLDVEVVLDEMPPAPKRGVGRPSKYHAVIDAARKVAAEARRKKQRAPDGGAPWVKVKDVTTSTFSNLRKKYGPGSEHHRETGESFELRLTHREQYGQSKSTLRGVLWVRQQTPPTK